MRGELKQLAFQFGTLLAGNLLGLFLMTGVVGVLMSMAESHNLSHQQFIFLNWLFAFVCFGFPALVSIFVFRLLGLFAFADHPTRSVVNLILCVLMPVITFVLFCIAAMPECWKPWLNGLMCSW